MFGEDRSVLCCSLNRSPIAIASRLSFPPSPASLPRSFTVATLAISCALLCNALQLTFKLSHRTHSLSLVHASCRIFVDRNRLLASRRIANRSRRFDVATNSIDPNVVHSSSSCSSLQSTSLFATCPIPRFTLSSLDRSLISRVTRIALIATTHPKIVPPQRMHVRALLDLHFPSLHASDRAIGALRLDSSPVLQPQRRAQRPMRRGP